MQGAEGLAREAEELGGGREPQGSGTRCTSTPVKPARSSAAWITPGAPRLNGPGWPCAGAGSCARRRMIEIGIEKKPLASGVE